MEPYYFLASLNHDANKNQNSTNRGWLWAVVLFALSFLLSFFSLGVKASYAQYGSYSCSDSQNCPYDQNQKQVLTKIVAINGKFSNTHDASIKVYPGDVISLMADQLINDGFGNYTNLYKKADEFMWSSSYSTTDFCAPAWQDCYSSNFETHEYGVNYYLPKDFYGPITITVINRNDGTYDQLVFDVQKPISVPNQGGSGGGYGNNPIPPSGGYYDDNSSFDYNVILLNYGRWVYINGVRVFVPYSYVAGWVPYRHGFWYYTSYGWTWYSYDPWGWITDHYGYWRHHVVYGWIWVPFPVAEFYWRPAVVSFYYTSYGVSWIPYYSGYTAGYVHGYSHGYDDGFWDGYYAALNSNYNHGVTTVTYNNFYNVTINNVVINNTTIVQNNITTAIQNQNFGTVIGSINGSLPHNIHIGKDIVAQAAGVQIANTQISVVPRPFINGNQVTQINVVRPKNVVNIPKDYAQIQNGFGHVNLPKVPVGSVINPQNGTVTPPKSVSIPVKKDDGTTLPPVGSAPRPLPPQQPRPAPAPAPAPQQPAPAPRPAPQEPMPSPRPAPQEPAPAPRPAPQEPAPSPRPAPQEPMPSPRPAPQQPAPSPRPAPQQPAPAPRPAPQQPAPSPRPAPQEPAPAPRPAPQQPAPAPSAPKPIPRPFPGGR
jgi:hypothetical protein